ncbi:class I SAM-dependent methyltransferase [Quisquiliibacterium transsilvanicum]|uniref:SAM-dependent methyltransferase n=1 Tax=Quisquiliibacterium transsilvanicum TaxID=1549638 RepID=A0A7W8HFS0_9BURK|nr:class I SAM-dependent methyltransferase [Quisquiliibacterium transsilvanicum]MBB5271042.1 SAM-dependent methyltransferase [Quisquiliibacterium transsilvanicum]
MSMDSGSAGAVADSPYSGRDNLDAMRSAVRYNRFLEQLVARHAPPGNGPVLDFGAGLGDFALALKRRGLDVSCLEVDASLAARAQAGGLHTVMAIDEISPQSLHYAYSLNVLEHIEDDRAALTGLRTRLQSGARVLVYVPAFQVLYSEMDRLVGHHRRYTRRSLEAALSGAGFRVEFSRYVDTLGFAASLLYRAISGSGTLTADSIARYDRLVFPLSRMLDSLTDRWIGKNVYAVAVV